MSKRSITSRTWLATLPAAALAGVLAWLGSQHGQLTSRQAEVSGRLVTERQTIEYVTNLRRDSRKAYVAVIESWLSPDEQRVAMATNVAARELALGKAVRNYAEQTGLGGDAAAERVVLLAVVEDWMRLFQRIEAAPGDLALGLDARSAIDAIDAACTAALKTSTANARADELQQNGLAEAKDRNETRLLLGAASLALYAVGWFFRAQGRRRAAEAERLRRLQQKHAEGLEAQVTERTAELALSNEKLGENMSELGAAKAELEKRIHDLALAQAQLVQSEKLQAVGQLAAGIAHEINTPVQFVGDSIGFLNESFTSTMKLLQMYRTALAEMSDNPRGAQLAEDMQTAEEEEDLEYFGENAPRSFSMVGEGLTRIATIVRAMKAFAHSDSPDKSPADLNEAILTTVTIAQAEYKYVAELETNLEPLPNVYCHLGSLNQVLLNLIVNASHAIGDVVTEGNKGRISIASRLVGAFVEITIADTGSGIPEAARTRIFEPFFTTKQVGKGTGQGLAIAHSIIVDKHQGELSFETEIGKGTTFSIRLPVAEPSQIAA